METRATLPHFKYDIFISYAHIDNEPLAGEKGWVDLLHERLFKRLGQLMGVRPKIYRDKRLKGHDFFDDALIKAVRQSRLLVSIASPAFLKSSWCRREFDAFVDEANRHTGMRLGDASRFFKVVKTYGAPLPHEFSDAVLLHEMLGYDFFTKDKESDQFNELDINDTPYAEKLEDLAQDISPLLQRLHMTPSERAAVKPEPSRKTIYLSQPIYDLRDAREDLRRHLQAEGYRVVPDRTLPMVGPEIEREVKAYAKEAELAVILLEATYGMVPERSTQSMDHLQYQAVIDASREADLHKIVWTPMQLVPKDDRQKAFLEQVELDLNKVPGMELVGTSLDELKQDLIDRLRAGVSVQNPQANGADTLYLIYTEEDPLDDIYELAKYLHQQGLIILNTMLRGENEERSLKAHKENLRICDSVLICSGNGSEQWLHEKLRDLDYKYGRKEPLKVKAIYLGPPPAFYKKMARFRLEDLLVIENFDGFSPNLLTPLVQRIKNPTGRD